MSTKSCIAPGPRCLLALAALSFAGTAYAQEKREDPAKYVREHYSKQEQRIPMRDGIRLYTVVYLPRDTSQAYPILMTRTPYSAGPYGKEKYRPNIGPNRHLVRSGYIFVLQDVRGRFLSEGQFDNMRPHRGAKKSKQDVDESTDTYDTIDWLVKNLPNHNGKVGLWGISYPGFYTSAGMIDAHP